MAREVTPGQLVADLAALSTAARARVHRTVVVHTAELEAQVKRNASGRPGPNVITGHYRRSINRRVTGTGLESVGMVGTDHPAGRRLELGFHGVDSLGRNYATPAFPHFAPALDEVEPRFVKAVGDAVVPQDGD